MSDPTLTYTDLVVRYGKNMAFDFLLTVEKLAKIRDNIVELDEETRFQRAMAALDSTSNVA